MYFMNPFRGLQFWVQGAGKLFRFHNLKSGAGVPRRQVQHLRTGVAMKAALGLAMILVCLSGPVMADRFTITPAVVSGDVAPGGGTFSSIDKHEFIFNKSGQLLLLGNVKASGTGLFLYDGANQQLVAKTGTQAAGMPAGTNYTYFAELSLATSGQVAFTGQSSQGGASWAGPVDGLQLVAKAGGAVPGSNLTFGSSFGRVSINSAGQVAFNQGDWLSLNGTNRAVWSGMPGAIELVAADGKPRPEPTPPSMT